VWAKILPYLALSCITPSVDPAGTGVMAILNAAYAAGFEASKEGWNAEYPFADSNEDFEKSATWVAARNKRLAPLSAALASIAPQGGEGAE
jgi:hypothetical protein